MEKLNRIHKQKALLIFYIYIYSVYIYSIYIVFIWFNCHELSRITKLSQNSRGRLQVANHWATLPLCLYVYFILYILYIKEKEICLAYIQNLIWIVKANNFLNDPKQIKRRLALSRNKKCICITEKNNFKTWWWLLLIGLPSFF